MNCHLETNETYPVENVYPLGWRPGYPEGRNYGYLTGNRDTTPVFNVYDGVEGVGHKVLCQYRESLKNLFFKQSE